MSPVTLAFLKGAMLNDELTAVYPSILKVLGGKSPQDVAAFLTELYVEHMQPYGIYQVVVDEMNSEEGHSFIAGVLGYR